MGAAQRVAVRQELRSFFSRRELIPFFGLARKKQRYHTGEQYQAHIRVIQSLLLRCREPRGVLQAD